MLRQPTLAELEATAALLRIPLKNRGVGPWVLNSNQRRIAAALIEGGPLIVFKIRQEGITTVCLLWLMLLALLNPGLRFAFVLQDERKAADKLDETIRAWLPQLGMKPEGGSLKVRLPNGSEIVGVSARGGEAEGSETAVVRSGTYAAAVLSEAAYYANDKVFPAIRAAVGRGPMVLESTVAGPDGYFSGRILDKSQSVYRVEFISVEDVDERCQEDPDSITDEEWESARATYGFQSRPHAAWWLRELEAVGGDVISMKREYPVTESDPFENAEHRWIRNTPSILRPVDATSSGVRMWGHLHPEHPYKQRTIITVDPSAGVGGDWCAAWVLDRETWDVVAAYWTNTEPADLFAPKVVEMARLYKPDVLLLETNGVGEAHLVEYRRLGLSPLPVVANRAEKYEKLLEAKRYVEARSEVPELLVDEARDLRVKVKQRPTSTTDHDWIGRKDGLISLGQGLLWLKRNPWKPEPERRERNYWDLIREAQTDSPEFYT